MPNRDFTFEIHESLADLEGLTSEWDDLLSRSDCLRPFLTAEWFKKSCEVFDFSPRVFVAKEKDRVVGILPLSVDPRSTASVAVLSYPRFHLAENTDVIVNSEDFDAAAALLGFALSHSPHRTQLFFRDIRKSANVIRATLLLQSSGATMDHELEIRLSNPYVNLARGWETYLSAKSVNFRRQLKTAWKQFAGAKLRLERLGVDSPDVDRAVDRFLVLHLQNIGETSHFADPKVQTFTKEVYSRMVRLGYLYPTIFRNSAGEIVGILIDAAGPAGKRLCYQHGYAPELEFMSPGKLLVASGIQRACQDGIVEYNLGRTSNAMKQRLQTNVENSFVLTLKNYEE